MTIYCDESGGVGRGVMTLAGFEADHGDADAILARFREVTGIQSEVKGSRIDLGERAFLFELLADAPVKAAVSIAISALKPEQGEDRGDLDVQIYAALLDDAVSALMPVGGDCTEVIIDDGRYGPETLSHIRSDIGTLIGPCGSAKLELSHRSAGLQIADVIANTFFNRALVGDRQARMAALVEPFLARGQIVMRVLPDMG